jgi:hypothetical protein
MATMKCPSGLKLVNGKCVDAKGNAVNAPYVSEKGAVYPDEKSLTTGCAKNPNSPGCKAIIDKMTSEQKSKIKGIQKLGGATKKKYNEGGVTNLKEVTITAKKKKYNNGGAANSKVRPVDDKTTKQAAKPTYKTGGMVNPNAKLQAVKSAGSKGVKPGVNPKAVAAKKATGKSSGGVDTPPKTAIPAAKYGKMMKKGGMVKAKAKKK